MQIVIIFILLIIFILNGCENTKENDSQNISEMPPLEVNTYQVKLNDIPVSMEYQAKIKSMQQVNVVAKVNGTLEKKNFTKEVEKKINEKYGKEIVEVIIKDQYYNMGEIIKEHMHIIEIAEEAMKNLKIQPIIKPIRGGTDGSKISFMGLPTPNIFAGGENFHGKYEFVSLESMIKATDVIIEIIKLNERKID